MLVKNARGETASRPMLPIVLAYGSQSVNASGLLDSGGDVNVLPYHLGIELGAIWPEQSILTTLSANLANYEARGIILTATVGEFAPARLAFAWTRLENMPLILGQVNFFAEFDVFFFRSQSVFEVGPKVGD